jgi:hypothetical protein
MIPSRRVLCVAVTAALLAWFLPAPCSGGAGADRVLIDKDLKRRPVKDVALDAKTVRFSDDHARQGTLPLSSVLALLPRDASDAPALSQGEPVWREITEIPATRAGRLDLVDGQSLPGRLETSREPEPDAIAWSHDGLGTLVLPLDRLSRLVLGAEARSTEGPLKKDRVELLNDDRVEGFVSAVSPAIVIEDTGRANTIALDRVRGVRFANPAEEPLGARVWLRDASVLSAHTLVSAGTDEIELTLPASLSMRDKPDSESRPPVTLRVREDRIQSVNFDASRLRPLASIPGESMPAVSKSAPGEARAWTPPLDVSPMDRAPMGLADIRLPGPMTASWMLPARTIRFAARAELPVHHRRFGDLILIVEVNAKELARERLNAGRPYADLNLVLPASSTPQTLRLTIDPGEGGPIQDEIVLHRAMILIDAPR